MSGNKHEMAWDKPKKTGDKQKSPEQGQSGKAPWFSKDDFSSTDFINILKKKWAASGGDSGGDKPSFFSNSRLPFFIAGLLFLFYILAGIYIVQPQEEGVVLRFGRYVSTVQPGPHWVPRFISQVIVVNVQGIHDYAYHANMLTKDENIVDVAVAVQYRVAEPSAYLFSVNNPVASLRQATASALRQVIGNTDLDSILTSGREKVGQDIQEQLINILAPYQTGIEITAVALQPAKAPEAVKDAFDDAIKAQEDEQRYINQAQAYRMQIIPQANGRKQRILANAEAYKAKVELDAKGQTARYLALLPQFQGSPRVTETRLYFDALQQLLQRSSKILVDPAVHNVFYLPLHAMTKKVGSVEDKQSQNMITDNFSSITDDVGDTQSRQQLANLSLDAVKRTGAGVTLSNYGNPNNPYDTLEAKESE